MSGGCVIFCSQDQLTGEKATVKGPTVWFPGPFERSGSKMTATALQDDEYIKVKDTPVTYNSCGFMK